MSAVFPTAPGVLGHIFRSDEGHVPDTPANRELLLAVANDESARCAQDAYRSEWFARTQENGTQVWVRVRQGIIINGGVNLIPIPTNSSTGLKRP